MYNTHSNSMYSSIPNSQYFIYVFAILSIFFFSISFSEPPTSEARLICANTTSSDPNFASKFVELMKILSNKFSVQGWASESVKSPSQEIFGLAQCYRHLSYADCQLCLTEARNNISRCGSANSGRLYLDGCFIRYDNYSFFTESVDPVHDSVTCDLPTHNLMDKLSQRELMKKVSILTHNVTENAQKSEGFAVGDIKGGLINVYALGQCWKTVNGKECYSCLENASRRVLSCVPSEQGRVMNAGCYLRYSIEKFYDENQHQVGGSSKIGVIVLIILGALAFLMLSLVGAVFAYVKILKKKEGHNQVYQVPDTIQKSNLNFKYEMLEGATNSFDPSMKLGQGGAGSVFKGTLPDGTTVAVKRLFFNTRQWVDEFFNEINSISGIEHKNLVRLLGCSIEGPESLLVYEYVPNKSLDQYLFQKNSTQFLSWQQRRDIILGIADGLAYLHGGAGDEGKIIHRDIKGSNILLDENLTPKIADFGLARSVAGDKTHISTGIAGTLGYMAPEYLVRGQLTDKADVYAFGVLVLEIACGRKSSVFMPGSDSVLQTVWKHYKSKNIVEVVDPRLEGQFSVQEASNVLQVGLLCTQASAALRPSMSEVVMMLNDKENTIPSPKQPPFLNSSVLGSDDSTKTSTMNSLTLNVNTIPDLSSTHKSSTTSDPEPVLSMVETIETR